MGRAWVEEALCLRDTEQEKRGKSGSEGLHKGCAGARFPEGARGAGGNVRGRSAG